MFTEEVPSSDNNVRVCLLFLCSDKDGIHYLKIFIQTKILRKIPPPKKKKITDMFVSTSSRAGTNQNHKQANVWICFCDCVDTELGDFRVSLTHTISGQMTHPLCSTPQMELWAIQIHIQQYHSNQAPLPPTVSSETYLLFRRHRLTPLRPSVYKNMPSCLLKMFAEQKKNGTEG